MTSVIIRVIRAILATVMSVCSTQAAINLFITHNDKEKHYRL